MQDRDKWFGWIAGGLLVVLIASRMLGSGQDPDYSPRPMPEWALPDLDGNMIRSTNYAGKAMLIDFWATWCPPCRKGIPDLIDLHKELESNGLVVVGISLDDGPEAVREFQKETGIPYPLVMGDAATQAAFGGIEGIPTTFIVDRNGQVLARIVGLASKAELEELVGKALASPPPF